MLYWFDYNLRQRLVDLSRLIFLFPREVIFD